jgi:hypothetical protein
MLKFAQSGHPGRDQGTPDDVQPLSYSTSQVQGVNDIKVVD